MKKLFVLLSVLLMLTACSKGSVKYKVGVIQIAQFDALDNATKGFEDVLKEEFGDEVFIDVKQASGDANICATAANEFVVDKYDLIMANATPSLLAASHATDTIPILGTSVTEYGNALSIENFNGVVGKNISGTSDLSDLDVQAQMILDLLPETKSVGIIYCSGEPNSIYQVGVVEKYLTNKGVTVETFGFADSNELAGVAQSACESCDALYIPTDNTCAANGSVIKSATELANVPVFAGEKGIFESCGGLASLTIDYYNLGKATGEMAIRVLKGEDISKMAIEHDPDQVKIISKEKASLFNVELPDGYTIIED